MQVENETENETEYPVLDGLQTERLEADVRKQNGLWHLFVADCKEIWQVAKRSAKCWWI